MKSLPAKLSRWLKVFAAKKVMGLESPEMGMRSPSTRRFLVLSLLVLSALGLSGKDASTDQSNLPAAFSTPANSPPTDQIGVDAVQAWQSDLELRGPGATLLYDNGPPLDDFGHPASQLSEAAPPWAFIAAAADDFQINDNVSPTTPARISNVRVATHFFGTNSGTATPTTSWTNGVFVTVYANAAGNVPSGQPDATGGQTGTVIASQLVSMASLTNQTLVNTCRTAYLVDIPVNIIIPKNTRFWISIVPRFNGPPQSAWVISANQNATTFVGKVGFPAINLPFWTDNPGNTNNCLGAPAAGSRKDLSFQLRGDLNAATFGACCDASNGTCNTVDSAAACTGQFQTFTAGVTCQQLIPPCAAVTGACCDDSTGQCTNGVSLANCQGPTQRFSAGQTCASLNPPCGDQTPGACCLPGGGCNDVPALQCQQNGGAWHAGTCATFTCPPANDLCANSIPVVGDTVNFDTTAATTDGPADGSGSCPNIQQDIWYSYTAPCTGQLLISLCDGTNFDSNIAVYNGCTCPPNLGAKLGCDNDGCGPTGPSQLTISSVTQGNCYLIRVGGVGSATGTGTMKFTCIPAGSGACCHPDHTCTIETLANCASPNVFTADQPCSPITCPPPTNDLCANAIVLTQDTVSFDTRGATTDGPADTPNPPCANITRDVWYKYTATCNGPVTISLCQDTNYDSAMAVYDDCNTCPPAAPPIACDNDSCGGRSAGLVIQSPTSGSQPVWKMNRSLERASDPYMPGQPQVYGDLRAVSQAPPGSVQVNVDGTGMNIVGDAANEPSIVINPTNPLRIAIGWRQFDTVASNFRQGGYGFSTNGGTSWNFPGVLEPGVFRSDPVLGANSAGKFFYASLKQNFCIDVYQSANGGITWPTSTPAYGADKQWMAIDRTGGPGNGHIYLVWQPNFTCSTTPAGGQFTRSTDLGTSWMNPIAIPNNPLFGNMTVASNGNVFVCGASPSTPNMIVARSSNAKNAAITPTWDFSVQGDFLGGVQAFGGVNPDGLMGQVNIAVNPLNASQVYLLCSVDPPGPDPLDVMFSRSTNGGQTWSTPVRINDDSSTTAYQWFGTMSVAPNGRIDVVWLDTRNDPTNTHSELWTSYSMNGGLAWTRNRQLTPPFAQGVGYPNQNKMGDYFDMISDANAGNLAYAATFNNEQDVYFTRVLADCNENGVVDSVDISNGSSTDANHDLIPDECAAGFTPGGPSTVTFNATSGQCYLIRIGGVSGATGTGTMQIHCGLPTGSCCLANGSCLDNQTQAQCQTAGGLFSGPGSTCLGNPCPVVGACCLPSQQCIVTTATECGTQSGLYKGDGVPCGPATCAPPNDECTGAIVVNDGDTPFNSNGATDSLPTDTPPCVTPQSDVWFKYTATCNGTVQIGLCLGTTFNAALTAYLGGTCDNYGPRFCDTTPGGCGAGQDTSLLVNGVIAGDTIWIRVGSIDASTGPGVLHIHCVPSVSCCPGDVNNDGQFNELDVPGLVDALTLNPPNPGTIEFCRADANGDNVLNGLDIIAFMAHIPPNSAPGCGALGGCCFPDGHCELRSQAACKSFNAVFQGPGTSCGPNPCSAATGACCLPGNSCQIQSFAECVTNGGLYQGDNTSCTPDPCGPPPACCKGDVNLNGVVDEGDIAPMVDGLLGQITFTPQQICAADINNDTVVDGLDLNGFAQNIVNQTPCTSLTCCHGDTNDNGTLDGDDIGPFIAALITPPVSGTAAYCRADANDDSLLDNNDVGAFVNLLLTGATCPP